MVLLHHTGIDQKLQEITETVKTKYGEETVPVVDLGTLIAQIQNHTEVTLDGLEQEILAKYTDEAIAQESFIESVKKWMEAKSASPDIKKTAPMPNVEKKKNEIMYLFD